MSGVKYINRKFLVLLLICGLVTQLLGCGQEQEVKEPYNVYQFDSEEQKSNQTTDDSLKAASLCVTDESNIKLDQLNNPYVEAAGCFNLQTHEVVYAKNLYEKLYPASTTKILTAILVLENGNLDDIVTVSEMAVDLPNGACSVNLKAGDKITVNDLLYGLLLVSGNDAANALAEYIGGSTEDFAKMMNEKAVEIGATKSHFVNANGLHDDDHYTSLYDLYLLFNYALGLDKFKEIMGHTSYDANYLDSNQNPVNQSYVTTNCFFKDEYDTPEGFTIYGGKTGTTFKAGHCMLILVENAKGNYYIEAVLKAENEELLYTQLQNMMTIFSTE